MIVQGLISISVSAILGLATQTLPPAATEPAPSCDSATVIADMQKKVVWKRADAFFDDHIRDNYLRKDQRFQNWIFGKDRACQAPSVCAVLTNPTVVGEVHPIEQTAEETAYIVWFLTDIGRGIDFETAGHDELLSHWGRSYVVTSFACSGSDWYFHVTPFFYETRYPWTPDYGR